MNLPLARISHLRSSVIFTAAFGVGLIVRLLVLWQAYDDPRIDVLTGDGAAYERWAHEISGGAWLGGPGVFYQTPLYPYFLAVLERVGIGLTAVRIVQSVLGSLACGMLAMATQRLLASRAAGL